MTDWEYMKFYEKKLKQNPNDIKVLTELGFLNMLEDGDHDKAICLLNHAFKLDQSNTEPLFWLAKTYYHCFYDEKAIKKTLKKALKINPSSAACHELLADVFNHFDENCDKSIYHLKKAVEAEPTWIAPRMRLSRYLMEDGKFDKAKAVAKKAYEIFKTLQLPALKTRMEEYYEESVRGRVPKKIKNIKMLLKDIKKARLKAENKTHKK